jgi:hypothetical protein
MKLFGALEPAKDSVVGHKDSSLARPKSLLGVVDLRNNL